MRTFLQLGIILAAFAYSVAFAQSSNANRPAALAEESAAEQGTNGQQPHRFAAVKSERDLYEHLISASDSPLHLLPPRFRWEFISSLVFTDQGLAGYRYDLLAILKPTDRQQLLSLFGVEHTASFFDQVSDESEPEALTRATNNPSSPFNWLYDYECEKPATCKWRIGYVCITDNC